MARILRVGRRRLTARPSSFLREPIRQLFHLRPIVRRGAEVSLFEDPQLSAAAMIDIANFRLAEIGRILSFAAAGSLVAAGMAAAEPLNFTDMTGRPVTLAGLPERIVALPLPAAPTLVAVDRSARRLVGVHPTARSIMSAGPLGRLFPSLGGVDTGLLRSGAAAFMPNVEGLMALGPDIVVQRGELGGAIVEPLESAGLMTLLVSYGTEEQTLANIRLLGKLVGQEERAEGFVTRRAEVAARLRGLAKATPPPSVLFLSRSAGSYTTTGRGTPHDHAIRTAGGRNLAGELPGSTAVGSEQLLLWDPDVIVLNSGDPELTPASLADDPILSNLSAVETARIYKAPTGGYRLEPPSPENPLYWLWLGAILHPSDASIDMRLEMSAGFAAIYGDEPTARELGVMLQEEANAQSADYQTMMSRR